MNLLSDLCRGSLLCLRVLLFSSSLLILGCSPSSKEALSTDVPGARQARHNQFAVRWILVSDLSKEISQTLARLKPVTPTELTGEKSVQAIGMQIRQLSMQEGAVADMVRRLGPAAADVTTWHGAIYQWRALLVVAIGPAPRAVAVAGQMIKLPAGILSLDCRAWPLLTENGEKLYLELVPVFQSDSSPDLLESVSSRRHSRVFETAAIRLMLPANQVYVISSNDPDTEAAKSLAGPIDPLDVHGDRQWTLGDLLFTRDLPEGSRGVLILMPWGGDPTNL